MSPSTCRFFAGVAAAVVLSTSGSARLDSQAAPTMFGGWRVARGVVAPWVKSDPHPNARVAIGDTMRFSTSAVGGSTLIQCKNPAFSPTRVPANALFQGNLTAPAASVAQEVLGFTTMPVTGVSVRCDTGVFEFHQADRETMLVAINNVIWTLTRAPGANASATSPDGVVERFMEAHFAGDMGFDKTTVLAKRAFFTDALLQQLNGYLAKPSSADEVPAIDGDAFTDSQEYPTRFAVSAAKVTGDRATVPVRFADGHRTHRVQYELRKQNGVWRIDDVQLAGKTSLTSLLKSDLLPTPPSAALPAWVDAQWTPFSKSRALVRATSADVSVPTVLTGDFDGDARDDVALLVDHALQHKRGIVILHHTKTPPMLVGAGVNFGNGGDDFAWMDHWAVVASTLGTSRKNSEPPRAALLVEKQEAGGGIIAMVDGRYRWRQYGN